MTSGERRVLIAANPQSGSGPSGSHVNALASALTQRGFVAEVIHSLEHLKQSACQLHAARRLETVVSAGGDGTVATLANLLPSDIPLLVFPLGTENLLAKHWGLTKNIDHAVNTLIGGRIVHMDVGSANDKLFLIMAGCGFDAEVVRQMSATRRGHIRRWTYAGPIYRAFKSYSFPQLRWSSCGFHQNIDSAQAAWLFLFNVPRYAANLRFCPSADPTDGKLDLCAFDRSGRMAGFRYLFHLWRGTHLNLPDVHHIAVRNLKIECPSDSAGNPLQVPFQLDGDPGGFLPLTISTLPGRLKLIVPDLNAASDPAPVLPLALSSA